jgi:uncharacterized membrane protein HdeD (DUF308 family)
MNNDYSLKNPDSTIAEMLTRNWWLLALRGLAAILFGILAFLWPGITLLVLVYLFSAYALVNGILAFVTAYRSPSGAQRVGLHILEGLLSIVAGVVAFLMPAITALAFLVVIATWAIINGILEIVAAIQLRKVIANEWLLILAGIASTLFGVLLLVRPGAGTLALIWWIGSFALIFGALTIAFAFRIKSWGQTAGGLSA